MISGASPPKLRLVGRHDDAAMESPSWRSTQDARLAVIKENRVAAHTTGLHAEDPRWMLAMQTQARLQGATLTPERREQLLASATKLGVRPFEANVIIAIVQDRARIGRPMGNPDPMLRLVSDRSEAAAQKSHREPAWPQWFAAIAAAAAAAALAVRWLVASG